MSFLAALLALVGATPHQEDLVLWPVGPGDEARTVLQTYGQLESSGKPCFKNRTFHKGVDIAAQPGEPVFAIEVGVVRRIQKKGAPNTGVVIESASYPGYGFAYWHLSPDSIDLVLGQSVNVDDYLGDVAEWSTPDFHHVHLAWVVGEASPGSGELWSGQEPADNPLRWVTPLADTDRPEILADYAQGASFIFRVNDGEFSGLGAMHSTDPSTISGPKDVIAELRDRGAPPGSWDLAPYRFALSIEPIGHAAPTEEWSFEFTGELPPDGHARGLYECRGGVKSVGLPSERRFHFILTNGATPGQANGVHGANAWDPSPGTYRFTLTVEDLSGNKRVVTRSKLFSPSGG